ncbi:hypothetical protein DIPPA_09582 [Diplonema papillatum]|nr:hypothetical protein DIPPA_09582 [Diplonema papillatum]
MEPDKGSQGDILDLLECMVEAVAGQQNYPLAAMHGALLARQVPHVCSASARPVVSSEGTWTAEATVACSDRWGKLVAASSLVGSGASADTEQLVQALGELARTMEGTDLLLVDDALGAASANLQPPLQRRDLFALSLAASLAWCRATLPAEPAFRALRVGYLAGRGLVDGGSPESRAWHLPTPVVTLFESLRPPSHPFARVAEVCVVAYTPGLSHALSLAREVQSHVLAQRALYPPGSTGSSRSVGPSGGVLLPPDSLDLNLLRAVAEAAATLCPPTSRLKILLRFADAGTCTDGAPSFAFAKKAIEAGCCDAVVDPCPEADLASWSALRGVVRMLCNTETDVALPYDLPVHSTVVQLAAVASLSEFAAKLAGLAEKGAAAALCASRGASADPAAADVAVAFNLDFAMFGGLGRGENTALWNQLLRIEEAIVASDGVPMRQLPAYWR